ncbi:tripartite tricarboxylate transporter TctB family protein [Inquilinus limosus]|uniref:tripartite tricarboxylate transporter TctB family protein n=1 Tax=Inquilinus limosus TaxID=171674 RepID=UPI00040FB340|nr:tripartite tricarboxylate transporter TctB family protein [Inquilinus limosus]
MRFNDAIFGAVLLLTGIAIAWAAAGHPPMPGQAFGAGSFPLVIGVALAVTALPLILSGLRQRSPALSLSDWARSPRSWRDLALTLAAPAVYILAADHIGFVPTAFVLLLVLAATLGARLVTAATFAAVMAVGLYLGFARGLRVPLPRGWLGLLLG